MFAFSHFLSSSLLNNVTFPQKGNNFGLKSKHCRKKLIYVNKKPFTFEFAVPTWFWSGSMQQWNKIEVSHFSKDQHGGHRSCEELFSDPRERHQTFPRCSKIGYWVLSRRWVFPKRKNYDNLKLTSKVKRICLTW